MNGAGLAVVGASAPASVPPSPAPCSQSEELINCCGLEAFRYWEALLGAVEMVDGSCSLSSYGSVQHRSRARCCWLPATRTAAPAGGATAAASPAAAGSVH